jgi:hypothetical protein
MSQVEGQLGVNIPAEVRIPFLNDFTRKYKIIPGPLNPGCGNGRHTYQVLAFNDDGEVDYETTIHFQEGALTTTGHNGVLSVVLLSILIDHFKSFQAGDFPSRETALMITKLEECLHWACARADERSSRGVLGDHKK